MRRPIRSSVRWLSGTNTAPFKRHVVTIPISIPLYAFVPFVRSIAGGEVGVVVTSSGWAVCRSEGYIEGVPCPSSSSTNENVYVGGTELS